MCSFTFHHHSPSQSSPIKRALTLGHSISKLFRFFSSSNARVRCTTTTTTSSTAIWSPKTFSISRRGFSRLLIWASVVPSRSLPRATRIRLLLCCIEPLRFSLVASITPLRLIFGFFAASLVSPHHSLSHSIICLCLSLDEWMQVRNWLKSLSQRSLWHVWIGYQVRISQLKL